MRKYRIEKLRDLPFGDGKSNLEYRKLLIRLVVFVHFERWYDSEDAKEARASYLDDGEAEIYYSRDWYWKARAYVPKKKEERKPRMQFKKKDEDWPTLSEDRRFPQRDSSGSSGEEEED